MFPLTRARSCGGGLPACPPTRCAGRQKLEPREAPGQGSGDPPETAQRRLQDQKAEVHARSRDALCSEWDRRQPCDHVGVGAPGRWRCRGGGIPSRMPPASPAPSPGSAAAREKGRRLFGEGGDPGVGGVVGLSLV